MCAKGRSAPIYYLRQCEKHSGPHSEWFYDLNQSGGGALMDMGCHGFAWFRWMLGAARPLSVYAHMQTGLLHGHRTRCEEHSVCIVEFEGGVIGVVENSWAKLGGMEDRVEVCGTGGVVYADLFMGNSALTYSEKGYGYAMEKAGSTQGWTFTNFEEAFNQGYPQELQAFHRLRARRRRASHDGRGRPRRARVDECRVPLGADRPESFSALSFERGQAYRFVARLSTRASH